MRVLALFDDAGQSVKTALFEHEVVSVGLNDKPTVLKMDLSCPASIDAIAALHAEQPFNLVMASPPCESWSFATASVGGNAYRFSNSLKLKTFSEWRQNTFNNVRRMVEKQQPDLYEKYLRYFHTGLNGEATATVTAGIVKRLGLPFVIENPASSMIWAFLEQQGLTFVKNKANYCAYDDNRSLKPTVFASEKILHLRTAKKANGIMKNEQGRGDGSQRANIPHDLVLDIVEQLNG